MWNLLLVVLCHTLETKTLHKAAEEYKVHAYLMKTHRTEGQIGHLFGGSGSWKKDGQRLVAKCKVGNREILNRKSKYGMIL